MRRAWNQRRREILRDFTRVHGRFLQYQAWEKYPSNLHRSQKRNPFANIHYRRSEEDGKRCSRSVP
ncbi:hypothetical protein CsSME_00044091 [Camellia sinensis var. sinensis]